MGRDAPPRRKACEDCSKSKRRCNLGIPACSRCSKLGFVCHYQVPPQRAIGQATAPEDASLETVRTCQPQLEVDGDVLTDAPPLPYGGDLDLPFTDEAFNPGTPLYPADMLSRPEVVPSINAVTIDLFNPVESRLYHTVELFKSSPSRMVRENSTSWCHALLYKDYMPKTMHDAYAACAMYIAKNDVNKMMIFRAIDRGATELVQSAQSTAPIELLARTQALLMYQIIRLFDGDIHLRAQGEANMGDLEVYSYLLLGLLDSHGMWLDVSEAHSSRRSHASPPSHATWIFQESCRRTVLMSLFFVSFYSLIQEGACIHGSIAAARSWTLSTYLWNAPSEFDFKVAWREKRHYVVQNLEFGEVLANASPDDIDDFGKSFMVMSQGLNEMREWYYNQGCSLE